MSRLRVTHVIETPGPGGAETVLCELVTRADASRFEVRAVVPTPAGWLGRVLPASVRDTLAPGPRSGPFDLTYLRGLRALFVEHEADVVHAHSFDSAFYSAVAVRGLRTRLAATFHGASDLERFGVRNRIKWAVLGRVDRVVAVSGALSRRAEGVPGTRPERIEVIHNGIDLSRFQPRADPSLRTRLGLPPDAFLFGAVGNVRPPKGYDVLLHAVSQLVSRGLPIHLAIAGDDEGPLADSLRSLRDSLGLAAHVTFVGFLDDVPSFLNGVDAFVLPSLSEGFSLSTVQALAAGLPVVATRSGGPEEIVEDGRSGILVAAGSVGDLADGMAALIGDASLRMRIAGAARDRALAAFSVEAMVSAYGALHERLASAAA